MENKYNSVRSMIDKNKNLIIGILAAFVLLVGGYFIYKNFFVKPKNDLAVDQMFQAQFMFDKDSFQMALNNPGVGGSGFLKIIDNYGNTETGNLAKYYAGICYLNLNDYDKAIKYLEDYNPSGDVTPAMTYAGLGDAYSEKKNDDKALSNYQKAASSADNDVTGPYTLKKLGMFQEKMGKWSDAEKSYKKILDDYAQTPEAPAIEVFYERAKLKAAEKK
ncbi:MAG: tetratricopeptide repeat protein [Saprospiraceae bacterium]|jgi:tetratricopeptide (TPR) repeat protein|uniref:tetratricopeptide repeat protein n=1 Tax=Candidatus Brachybacter algidus TaxID=2982024 RepID=UPI001B417023|nr:tetratricopeptide repeat protein [Candidatus Brachybacter algidus]MBP7306149.1 tetratricopeptide repeat protein [Saprospiraceae bacterium]MBK6372991.1 tetratricopeptide repeat protein [Candidatus Brachybacter algidus]MBK6447647.1 tetratricopeptide repeat protein [Candidatus Brachybacter algidus]MBK7602452.1 tetratricopeptide repeat protein [Candidatus Brachybacter algidus]MBK8354879.1 tetratricopeptide repeat protein [Candidatus Brachybacter algidus]